MISKRILFISLILATLISLIKCAEKPTFDEQIPDILSKDDFAECTIYNGEHTHHYLIAGINYI